MRRLFLIVSAVSLVLLGTLQLIIYLNRPATPEELRLRAAVMPALHLVAMDGQPYVLTTGRPLVLIYFNTTCDHCLRQVEWMRREFNRFDGVAVVFMSSQPETELRDFVGSNEVVGTLVRVKPEEVAEKLGVLALPQLLVYDARGELTALFSGETDPLKVRQVLP